MKLRIKSSTISFRFLFLLLCVSSFSASITAQEVEDEREFDYRGGSENGPAHWGDLKQDWATCKNGTMQSPIDVSDARVRFGNSRELRRSYQPCNATIKNRGHDISLQWKGYRAGKIVINGTAYYLEQAHWHSPSEHTIRGRRYDMELHMVHVSPEAKLAVVAVLFKAGSPDAFLSKLMSNVTSMIDRKDENNIGVVDPNEIGIRGKKYYKYVGSLTVPPCTEGVVWIINKKIETVSKDQMKALRTAVHDYAEENARPVQPVNHRRVTLYGPKPGGASGQHS